jgi:CBS domain-containing protein
MFFRRLLGEAHLLRDPVMATARDILAKKGKHILSISPEATVLDAALLMNEHKIGSLLVMSGGTLVGILTERDILERVVANCRNPSQTPVQDAMTTEVVCCQPHTSIDEARGVMKNRRLRHLPVVDEADQLHGLISIGDLNAHMADDQEFTIHILREYIHGRV